MVRETIYSQNPNGQKQMTLKWDGNNPNDAEIIKEINKLLCNQPACANCKNYREDGYYYGGFLHHICVIHGDIDAFDNPHFDRDGSKCSDYSKSED